MALSLGFRSQIYVRQELQPEYEMYCNSFASASTDLESCAIGSINTQLAMFVFNMAVTSTNRSNACKLCSLCPLDGDFAYSYTSGDETWGK